MVKFSLTIFISAFLLFQVQPIMGRFLLPWYGGATATWTSCLVFFQTGLLFGYSYAHVVQKLTPRFQGWAHLVLLGLTLLFLPIVPDPSLVTQGAAGPPSWQIIVLLLYTVGLPYAVLSSSGPLLQSWFRISMPNRSPYRLFALSNAGSLLGLLSYPFLVEPLMDRKAQIFTWSTCYVLFVLMSGVCVLPLLLKKTTVLKTAEPLPKNKGTRPSIPQVGWWLLLSAMASMMLMASTNQICQEVAVFPFLWVLPLSLYLLTFIICFDKERWYDRRVIALILFVTVPIACYALHRGVEMALWAQIVAYSLVLFSCCMVCHGELVRRKPDAKYLTLFYLAVSLGGVLGGLYVTFLAPMMFVGYWEFHVALVGCTALAITCWYLDRKRTKKGILDGWRWVSLLTLEVFLIIFLVSHVVDFGDNVIAASRNFYGVLRVTDRKGAKSSLGPYRNLYHGRVKHGHQFSRKEIRQTPTTYFSPRSGVGKVLENYPRPAKGGLEIGILGLGVGTLAAYGRNGDRIRFYEIDAAVEKFARSYFFYLADSQAEMQVILGDGRIRMEEEVLQARLHQFDILILDAFSSDAVPIHLLTSEAFEIYWRLLKPQGLLLINITNRFVDLRPVIRAHTKRLYAKSLIVETKKNQARALNRSTWIIMARRGNFLEDLKKLTSKARELDVNGQLVQWSDDFATLWPVLK